MKTPSYDRASQDVGNILLLEHVNVTVPDQLLATQFYVSGLGLTRDPYVDFGPFNVWINAGEQQFHLPTNKPQVLRGHTGLVVPSLEDLATRLARVAPRLKGTCFSTVARRRWIDVTCPYGNHIRCYEPGSFGEMKLGIPYVELRVPIGTSEGIGRFYRDVMAARTSVAKGLCTVHVGTGQSIRFRETPKKLPDYDGHHIAIYISNFSVPHKMIKARGLLTQESDAHQYRFTTLFDPVTGESLFEL
ncbi:MAG: hypothetical protein WD558_06530, partial [Pseudomonadales bacterium]